MVNFDFYEIEYQLGEDILRYCFEIKQGAEICFYSRYGITGKKENYYDFIISPGFKTPEWAKGAVMYQIFVDRFCNGDPTNDVEDNEYILYWGTEPQGEGLESGTGSNGYP